MSAAACSGFKKISAILAKYRIKLYFNFVQLFQTKNSCETSCKVDVLDAATCLYNLSRGALHDKLQGKLHRITLAFRRETEK